MSPRPSIQAERSLSPRRWISISSTDIRGAVDRAIAEGATLGGFQDELEPLLARRGWWGRAPMLDPVTGETRIVQLGSPHRLRTIFETNLRTSYAAGRWERIQRVAEHLPYLRYVAVLDGRTREEHAAWHGTVALASDDFWRGLYTILPTGGQ